MAVRFTKLNNAMKTGLEEMQPAAAVEQIEYWQEQLKSVDVSGSKGIVSDLEALKAKLSAEKIDGKAVTKLLSDLGDKTTKIGGRVDDEKIAEQLKHVGDGLEKAA